MYFVFTLLCIFVFVYIINCCGHQLLCSLAIPCPPTSTFWTMRLVRGTIADDGLLGESVGCFCISCICVFLYLYICIGIVWQSSLMYPSLYIDTIWTCVTGSISLCAVNWHELLDMNDKNGLPMPASEIIALLAKCKKRSILLTFTVQLPKSQGPSVVRPSHYREGSNQ